MKAFLLTCSLLFLVSSYSYSETYSQQYQIGDTGPNGGIVTDVIITSTFVGEEVVQEGDFLEVTETYQYTETITEEVATESTVTTEQITSVTTSNLVDEATYTDTNINIVGNNYGMNGAEITTGNQGMGGGTRVYLYDFTQENMQSVEYGTTVYSHVSNGSVPACANTTTDCRDDWRLTVRLYNDGVLIDTVDHTFTGIDWTGSRDYSWTQDVSSMTFNSGELELYGIDRGYYGGYYGVGFSDTFAYLTYNVIEQVVQSVVSYAEMQTVTTTDVYVYDSIYNPQVTVTNVDVQPITETEFEITVEVEAYETQIVEVFEIEVDAPEFETFDEIESDVEVIEVETDVVDVEVEDEVSEEPMPEADQDQEQVEVVEVSEPTEDTKAEEQKPEVEAKAQSYSPVLDSIKVALMVQNATSRAFEAYKQETIPDVPFYSPVSLDGGQVIDNPYSRWMTGASDVRWDNMVDMQWQK